jgi:CRISPR/Cas system-associated exonuclease Cas4 (RecB family)
MVEKRNGESIFTFDYFLRSMADSFYLCPRISYYVEDLARRYGIERALALIKKHEPPVMLLPVLTMQTDDIMPS